MRCPALRELPSPPQGKTGWPWTEGTGPAAVQDHGLTSGERSRPRISIVMPSYNQSGFIEEAIRSVLLQGYPDLELIVMDGGSDDGSVDVIKKYEKWISYWVSEKDAGQSDAINRGFSRASGEVFAWLNSDDMYYPGALARIGRHWAGHDGCHFIAGDGEIVDSGGSKREYYIKTGSYSVKDLLGFYRGRYLAQPSVFFSAAAFREAGGLDPDLYITMDLDLWIRIRKRYPLCYLGGCMSKLRRHGEAKTTKREDLTLKEVAGTVMRHYGVLKPAERLLTRAGLRFYRAEALCRAASAECSAENRRRAAGLLIRAALTHPGIIFTGAPVRLAARIIIPLRFGRRDVQRAA